MPKGFNSTIDQHYIPQMYLKGFSESVQKSKEEKFYIWQYNIKKMQQIKVPVPIKSVCYEENLYELRNNAGEFVARNLIENTFGRLEYETSKVIESIKEKVGKTSCYDCEAVLSEYDKSILIIFMNSLIFRDPVTIENGMKVLQKNNPNLDSLDARNFTLMNLLPIGEDTKWNEHTVIRSAINRYNDMAFQIGVSDSDDIITCDRPIVEWPSMAGDSDNRPRAVAFPLTSRMVLYLYPIENVSARGKSCIFHMDEQRIRDMQHNIAVYSIDYVFSKTKFSEEQVGMIENIKSKVGE